MILVYISIQFIHLENFFHPVSQNIFISREEGDKKEKKFTVSSIHSNQKRNPPSSIRSLPYRLDRGGHAPRFLAGLTFSRVQKRAQSFHFAQSGHSACIRSSGIGRSISSAYYAIISLTSPRRRGREGELSHQKW